MRISYEMWLEEVAEIKKANGFVYLTKKRCKNLYGWSWKFLSARRGVIVTFHTPSAESFYRLKWNIQ